MFVLSVFIFFLNFFFFFFFNHLACFFTVCNKYIISFLFYHCSLTKNALFIYIHLFYTGITYSGNETQAMGTTAVAQLDRRSNLGLSVFTPSEIPKKKVVFEYNYTEDNYKWANGSYVFIFDMLAQRE